ncbi:hypothetical protein [Rhizobium laguerreae]|uniref:hypothetical protein n=1 Tax=Rhizobium laguerreae TaxID=1076926 RepID=UPI001C9035EC|nr:hypothetical protein [Rhizobium laguerreae]MBY3314733.1 hypothetical protein [Rhizobium laguerreae]
MSGDLTVQVPKGTRVNIEEMDNLRDDDPRVPNDRNVIITTNKELKIAIKRSDDAVTTARASVVLMCG